MSSAPRRLLRDSVTFEPYQGEGATGPVYGYPVTVLGKVSMIRQLVLSGAGAETISEATVYLDPEDAEQIVPESRATIDGRASTVITVGAQSRPGQRVLVKVTCT